MHEILPEDRFVIFASDGLWEHLSNQEAVDIVQNHPNNAKAGAGSATLSMVWKKYTNLDL
ncbi:putative [Pyruvate dehydrogenase (acetyl-transferring)]-phosphatase [Helianthus annuus]|nr:putative [Pyruvate dehydrogenase (acetyl-transferring)]-phosphatase [Helianthus annuus]KAJ0886176.1 putative [Pyruvate dehydrogenase (acetyl-transferring)]-phosphatase [Helianthus annuus]